MCSFSFFRWKNILGPTHEWNYYCCRVSNMPTWWAPHTVDFSVAYILVFYLYNFFKISKFNFFFKIEHLQKMNILSNFEKFQHFQNFIFFLDLNIFRNWTFFENIFSGVYFYFKVEHFFRLNNFQIWTFFIIYPVLKIGHFLTLTFFKH
jgi:hypothetical protein